jgi:hypothetical protein
MRHKVILNHFPPDLVLPPPWKIYRKGEAALEASGEILRLVNTDTTDGNYSNAQIDDYQGLARRDFLWQPPLQLTVRARFSHPSGKLRGTAGFGFWNAPFGDPTVPWPTLPQAAWFFYGSPPTDLPLALEGPGRGWFASTINARSRRALALMPAAPLVLLLNQFRRLRERIWPPVREQLGMSFRPLELDMTEWHSYRLDWEVTGCTFFVDGERVLQSSAGPGGPMGFVCWIDNQYMVLTVRGRFGWGTIPVLQEQSLAITNLEIHSTQ